MDVEIEIMGGEEEVLFEEGLTHLSLIAEAFEELAQSIGPGSEDLRLAQFTNACSLVSVLFSCLGIVFKFAEIEYVAKVRDLMEASKTYGTLKNILDVDVKNNSVRKPGSLSRNLRRVRQGLDLIKALFEQFLSPDCCSLRNAASTAYGQVCAPYHTWAIRRAVGAGMYTLPTREQLLLRLHETDHSAEKEMKRYIAASSPVIQYIDKLYIAKNISLDW
ncbi:ACD11 homolog protein-like [Tasmannia lanceolata]|uniref:ACD11 homolog protein-like n=1 Tax=Tasmannia lanceolata TaxID=3420 RepID=UPI00406341DF